MIFQAVIGKIIPAKAITHSSAAYCCNLVILS